MKVLLEAANMKITEKDLRVYMAEVPGSYIEIPLDFIKGTSFSVRERNAVGKAFAWLTTPADKYDKIQNRIFESIIFFKDNVQELNIFIPENTDEARRIGGGKKKGPSYQMLP